MVYKIGLISTHGTGKTTLARLVEGELKRRGVEALTLPEISTMARERGLPINEETTLEAQLWILHRQFAEELMYSHPRQQGPNPDVIICDRGPDNFCYLERRFPDDPKTRYALELVQGHLQHFKYNQLYLLPIVDKAIDVGAGVRSANPEFQQEMDDKIHQFLRQEQLAYSELPLPQATDNYRQEWIKIIVNQTLDDLRKLEGLRMK